MYLQWKESFFPQIQVKRILVELTFTFILKDNKKDVNL